MFAAKLDELGHAGHGAVFVHDFADDAGIIEAGDAREIDAGFGLPGADEDAAVAGAQRKHVPRPREILWLGLGIDCGKDSYGSVGGADAGGDSDARVDGFAERSTMDRSIDRRHEREVEFVAALLGEREAN